MFYYGFHLAANKIYKKVWPGAINALSVRVGIGRYGWIGGLCSRNVNAICLTRDSEVTYSATDGVEQSKSSWCLDK